MALKTSEPSPLETWTVKGLCWKLLYANHRPSLGPARWARIIEQADGPRDVKNLALDDDVPAAPFVEALNVLDVELADGDGSFVEQAGRAMAERWATMYRRLVAQLDGRPERMLELLCEEVLPWLTGRASAASLVSAGDRAVRLRLRTGFPAPFEQGLVEGFVELTGTQATLSTQGSEVMASWEPVQPAVPSKPEILLQAMRPGLLPATIVPVLAGTAVAAWLGTVHTVTLAAALVAATLLHVAANLANDVFDHRSGTDQATLSPTPFSGGSRVIQRGLLDWRAVAYLAAGIGALGAGLGLTLAWVAGPPVLVLGAIGAALGYAYTGEPFRLAHRGLGELTVAVVFGPLITAGAAAVHFGQLPPVALITGVPLGLAMAGTLMVNELPDAPWDAKTGKRTLVVRLADHARTATAAMALAPILTVAALVALGSLPPATLIVLAALPLAGLVARGVLAHEPTEDLVATQAQAVTLHAMTGLLLAAGLVVEVVLG